MRGGIWTVFFLVLFPFARPTISTVVIGSVLVILGQMYRHWATGCIVNYRGEKVGAEQLVTWGPYALSRNPLYLANGVMGLGWALMVRWWAIPAFLVVFYLLYVVVIIPHESHFLENKFGDDYRQFQKDVPMLFPSFRRWQHIHDGPYNRWVVTQREIYSLGMTILITALLSSRLGW